MKREEKIELLLKCRGGEIEGEDFLKQLQVPVYGYTKFLCYEILYWENPEEEIIKEMERASEPFFQKMIEDIENGIVIGPGNALELLKNFGFQFVDEYFQELAEKVKAKDPSVFGSVKMDPIIVSSSSKRPSTVDEFEEALNSHPDEGHEQWFDELANCLMNHLVLQVGENRYRIVVCEFYYNDKERKDKSPIHRDPYVHCGKKQLTSGEFYCNKAGGLDITFGSQDIEIHGGILIRGLKNLDDNSFINGVWCITEEVINNMGSLLDDSVSVRLSNDSASIVKHEPTKGVRVNLPKPNVSSDDFKLHKEYFLKPYRYVVEVFETANKYKDKLTIQAQARYDTN
jgi:hypothetical protein